MKMTLRTTITAAMLGIISSVLQAQDVMDELTLDVSRAAGLRYVRPSMKHADTPAPDGKRPFYINHYGCPAAYYAEQQEIYDNPYQALARADSLGKLTKLGRDVLRRVRLIRADANNRTGELTARGVNQSRELTTHMVERFPDVFIEKGYYSSRAIVANHCIQTMGESMVQLSQLRQPLKSNILASHRDRKFMDPVDNVLEAERTSMKAVAHYTEFVKQNTDDQRLIASLFNDADYVASHVDTLTFGHQLFILAGCVQLTGRQDLPTLYDIFTPEEIHRHWRRQNAWSYMNYGFYQLNGGNQPFMQRATLRNMMHMGDSVLKRYYPIIHTRYTNEGVVMALACLMELDSCGLKTNNFEDLEKRGWADYRIAPLGGSVQIIHYRRDREDQDVLVKVLLNGREASLPIATDCAPYYHWQDVKRYYLRKLYKYENSRFTSKIK